ncbi:MAG TPA: class I SAM-dependent methyltransferase [Verrucomicrobiae bacterium]|nr:class I SAM-dependent methyltransferase [Verrucomicrobiae bacterium]
MSTNYDPIAGQYRRAKLHPWRAHVEAHTFFEVIGDLAGKHVLDLACGEGFYSRLLKAKGAASVTGVDLSVGMIALAKEQEAACPLGIRYLTGDAKDLPIPDRFDLVVAAYLLNYAATRAELGAMLRSISRALKPGGRFVTVNCNPACLFPTAPSYRKYGFQTHVAGEWREGVPIHWTLHLNDGAIELENYYLSVATHEAECAAAGLGNICWHAARLSPGGAVGVAPGYWDDFLTTPPIICLECVKAG